MTTDRTKILLNGFNECLKHHTCGDYISMSDVEGLDSTDITWYVNTNSSQLIAFTEFGTYHHQYDFDFSFDENLNIFVDGLREFLINEVSAKRV